VLVADRQRCSGKAHTPPYHKHQLFTRHYTRYRHRAHGRAGPYAQADPANHYQLHAPAEPKDPDTCTLVALLRAFAEPGTVAAVERRYRTGGIGYGEVKAQLADAIDKHIAPMRNRYQRLLTDPAELNARLAQGAQHACQRADRTLARTMVAMGL